MIGGRRNRAVAMVTFALIAIAASACTSRRPHESNTGRPPLAELMSQKLAERIVAAAESDSSLVGLGQHARRVACVAEAFGAEPEPLTDALQAQKAYANLYCVAIAPNGQPGEEFVAPVAVTFAERVTILKPADGNAYTDSVRRIIPQQWWNDAFGGLKDPENARRLLYLRIEALSSAQPSPTA